MDSREFSTWLAFDRFFEPIGDEWRQTGLQVAASLAPYCPRGKTPRPEDFMPLAAKHAPQHATQMQQALSDLAAALGVKDGDDG